MSSGFTKAAFPFKKLFHPLTTRKAILIIIITGVIVFSNALLNGFVWDDGSYILNNREVHSVNIFNVFRSNYFNNGSYYRPIQMLYYSFLYLLFVKNAFFYHLLQITLHIVNAALLFTVYRQFFHKHVSLLLALFFLIHPIQVESVSYISASTSPLFFLFGILAFIVSLKDTLDWKRLLLIVVFLLLSVLAKEIGFLFFFLILTYRLLFKQKNIRYIFLAGGLVLSLYLFLRFGVAKVYLEKYLTVPIAMLTKHERLLNIPAVFFYYLKTFFFPIELSVNQQWVVTKIDASNFYFPVLIIILLSFSLFSLGVYLSKYQKELKDAYFFFLVWFLSGFLLILQIFPLDMTVADRWFYYPIVGLLGILGVVLKAVNYQKKKVVHVAFFSVIILILIILSFRTISRNANWKDNMTLYSNDRQIHTNSGIESGLGREFAALSEYDKAITHFLNAVAMNPCEENLFNLAYGYESKDNIQNARKYYLEAMQTQNCKRLNKNHQLATYIKLGRILILSNDPEDANQYVTAGLVEYPQSSDLWALLAVSDYSMHNQKDAIMAAEKAKELKMNNFTQHVYTQIVNEKPIELELYLK